MLFSSVNVEIIYYAFNLYKLNYRACTVYVCYTLAQLAYKSLKASGLDSYTVFN